MAETITGAAPSLLAQLLQKAQLDPSTVSTSLMIKDNFNEINEKVSPEDRFLSALSAVVFNVDTKSGRYDKGQVMDAVGRIDQVVNDQLNEILHHETFQSVEASWRGISDLVENTNFSSNVTIDLLDVSKEELYQDFESNSTDVFSGDLFSKVYKTEFDQYGGKPYGCLLGLYEFSTSPRDLFWLRNMSKVAAAAHAPFISAVAPEFFGCKTVEEVEAIRERHLQPAQHGAVDVAARLGGVLLSRTHVPALRSTEALESRHPPEPRPALQ
jgi:type VI secretion system protein ImpC